MTHGHVVLMLADAEMDIRRRQVLMLIWMSEKRVVVISKGYKGR